MKNNNDNSKLILENYQKALDSADTRDINKLGYMGLENGKAVLYHNDLLVKSIGTGSNQINATGMKFEGIDYSKVADNVKYDKVLHDPAYSRIILNTNEPNNESKPKKYKDVLDQISHLKPNTVREACYGDKKNITCVVECKYGDLEVENQSATDFSKIKTYKMNIVSSSTQSKMVSCSVRDSKVDEMTVSSKGGQQIVGFSLVNTKIKDLNITAKTPLTLAYLDLSGVEMLNSRGSEFNKSKIEDIDPKNHSFNGCKFENCVLSSRNGDLEEFLRKKHCTVKNCKVDGNVIDNMEPQRAGSIVAGLAGNVVNSADPRGSIASPTSTPHAPDRSGGLNRG